MAKKPRTPPPPKRVQAPQRRDSRQADRRSAMKRDYLAMKYVFSAAAAAVALAAIAAVLFFVLGKDDHGSATTTTTPITLARALAAAGCTAKTFKDKGRNHLAPGEAEPRYNSFPATSGTHDPTPAIWNFYNEALLETQAVHNLEHGGMVVNWGSGVPKAQVDQLHSFWEEDPNGMLMFPLPQLGKKIALTAWTQLATCPRFDKAAFTAFRSEYRGKGPERFPVSSLAPGS